MDMVSKEHTHTHTHTHTHSKREREAESEKEQERVESISAGTGDGGHLVAAGEASGWWGAATNGSAGNRARDRWIASAMMNVHRLLPHFSLLFALTPGTGSTCCFFTSFSHKCPSFTNVLGDSVKLFGVIC